MDTVTKNITINESTSFKFSTHSCDRCFKRKKRCSLHLPSCTLCLISNIECTYNRPKIKVRRLPVSKLTIDTVYSEEKDGNKRKLMENKFAEQLEKSSKFSLSCNLQIFSNQVRMFMTKSHLLQVLVGLANIPVYSQVTEDRLIILSLIGLQKEFNPPAPGRRRNLEKFKQNMLLSTKYGTPDLYFRAVEAYFTYINPFLPIFTRRSFLARPRSKLLSLAIYLCGIRLLKVDKNTLPWYNDLLFELLALTYEAILKPNLDSLQALFIIRSNLFLIPQFASITSSMFYNLVRIAHNLGLHLEPNPHKIKCEYFRLERKLTYVTIVYYTYLNYRTNRDSYYVALEISSSKSFKDMLYTPSISSLLNKNYSHNDIVDLMVVRLSCYSLMKHCHVLHSLILVRHLIYTQDYSVASINYYIDNLVQYTIRSMEKDRTRIRRVHQLLLDHQIIDLIPVKKLGVMSDIMYQRSLIFGLELYGYTLYLEPTSKPNVRFNLVNTSSPAAQQLNLQLILANLNLVQMYFQLDQLPYLPGRLFSLAYSISFLSKQPKVVPKQDRIGPYTLQEMTYVVLNQGVYLLTSFNSYPNMTNLIKLLTSFYTKLTN